MLDQTNTALDRALYHFQVSEQLMAQNSQVGLYGYRYKETYHDQHMWHRLMEWAGMPVWEIK